MNKKTYFKMTKDAVTGAPEIVKEKIGEAKTMVDTAIMETSKAGNGIQSSLEEKTIDIKKFGSSIPSKLMNPMKTSKTMIEKKIEKGSKDLEDALPTIAKAGFELISVDVEIGTSPKLIPRFKIVRHLTEEERKAVESEPGVSRMTKGIITALLQTQLISTISIGSLGLHIVELHLGAIPKARVRFSKQ